MSVLAASRHPERRPDVDPVEVRLRALRTKPALDLEAVHRAVDQLRSPGALRRRLGPALRYSQRVEADVAGLAIDTLLPHAPDDHLGRFLDAWVPDELGHAASQALLLAALDLPPAEVRPPDHVPVHNRIAGALGRLSSSAHGIVSMTFHSIGAMNERLAMAAYGRMSEIAIELGEAALADDLLRPTYRDEAFHLGYYRAYARSLRGRLARWQLAVAQALVVHTYFPVGAGERRDRAPFGEVVLALEEDPDDPAIAAAVHDIAQDLLARPGEQLSRFVHRAIARCVALARPGSPPDVSLA